MSPLDRFEGGLLSPKRRARLLRLARHLVGESAAEDLVQQAHLRLLEKPPRHGGALFSWLETVMRNLALESWRSEDRRRRREERVARAELQSSEEADVERRESFHLLEEVLSQLPEHYRVCLHLRYFEDRSVPQIAAQLGVPEGTVRTRIGRALARMRETLDRRSHGDRSLWTQALLGLIEREPVRSALRSGLLAGGMLGAAALLVLGVALAPWFEPDRAPPRFTAPISVAEAKRPAAADRRSEVELRSEVVAPVAALGPREWWYAGRIVDPSGAAVAGARVELWDARGVRVAERTADPSGCFDFAVPAMARRATFSAPGFARALVDVEMRGCTDRAAPFEVQLGPGRTQRGRVVDAVGAPLGAARLWAMDFSGHAVLLEVSSDSEGRFELEGLPRDESTRLLVEMPGYAFGEARSLPDEDLTVVLSEPGGSVLGSVRDDLGRPIDRSAVRIERPGSASCGRPGCPEGVRFTDADGRVEFPSAPLGRARLFATSVGHLAVDRTIRVDENGLSLRLELRRTDPGTRGIDLEIETACAADLARAEIEVRGDRGQGEAVELLEDGRVRVRWPAHGERSVLRCGDPRFALRAPGSVAGRVTLERRTLDRPPVVELVRTGRFEGRVVDEWGAGVARADVLLEIDGEARARALSDASGAFVLATVPPDVAAGTLILSHEGLTVRQDVELPQTDSGRRPSLVLPSEGLPLIGVVVDADGRPLPGRAVRLAEPDAGLDEPRFLARTTTDLDGTFSFLARGDLADLRLEGLAGRPSVQAKFALLPDFRGRIVLVETERRDAATGRVEVHGVAGSPVDVWFEARREVPGVPLAFASPARVDGTPRQGRSIGPSDVPSGLHLTVERTITQVFLPPGHYDVWIRAPGERRGTVHESIELTDSTSVRVDAADPRADRGSSR